MEMFSTRSGWSRTVWWALAVFTVIVWAGDGRARAGDDDAAIAQAKGISRAFRAAAKRVLPTVVQVKTANRSRQTISSYTPNGSAPTAPRDSDANEDASRSPKTWSPDQPGTLRPGLGSGVIIDPSGIILTNHHVVAHAEAVVIELADGRQFPAVDVKFDRPTDLAIVRIRAPEPLPAAKLGNSDQLEIGDWVLAIGSPFELDLTVSAGIISAKGRSLNVVGRAKYLQTDAAINPGNSGGPLVNLDGEVVGINTAIVSRNGGNQGIGFAVPVNLVKWISSQLVQTGTVKRSYLGVTIEKVPVSRAAQLKVPPKEGCLVSKVHPQSPAEAAGMRENDVILKIDGRSIDSPSDLQEFVERLDVESKHRVQIVRQGKPETLLVGIKTMPTEFSTSVESGGTPRKPSIPTIYRNLDLGLVATDLTPELANQYGYSGQSGVLVAQLDRQGAAYRAGLREGMLIVGASDRTLQNTVQLKALFQPQALADGLTLHVRSRQGAQTIVLKTS